MTILSFAFRFTPAQGGAPRDIKVIIAAQDDEHYPLILTIEWNDGESPDRLRWRGPPLIALELAARFAAQRILDHVEFWGGGTLEPDVGKPHPWIPADDAKSEG